MIFFKKKYKLELLSLHIPKTAGTSFRNILKEVYDENSVVRFDINEKGEMRLNQEIYIKQNLPEARVIHGHFTYKDINTQFDLPEDIQKITWLRNPVERVISNYFYLESRLKTLLNEEQNNLNILSKMQRSLIEYARDDINRNRQSKFLSGITLEEFDFVGIQEDFENDLIEISNTLKWEKLPNILHQNKTPVKKNHLDIEIIKEIELLNQNDMELYKNALHLRGKSF
tara:strand:- start:5184 stop:5867 length:684 start_codon:yes stop_codon:yes gene_type:complete